MKIIYIASKNTHKIKEISYLLMDLDYEVRGLDEFKGYVSPKETGKTFIENTKIKASSLRSFFNTNKPENINLDQVYILADDSGLECDDLGGLPGVNSARFAGENATTQENNAKLVQMINEATCLSRSAQYVCAMVLLMPNGEVKEIIETCRGRIVTVPKGTNGFGYDPYFFLEDYNKCMAEISLDEKNKISHRGKALAKLVKILR